MGGGTGISACADEQAQAGMPVPPIPQPWYARTLALADCFAFGPHSGPLQVGPRLFAAGGSDFAASVRRMSVRWQRLGHCPGAVHRLADVWHVAVGRGLGRSV